MGTSAGTGAMLWEWHYLVFILPFAVGALLLILSSMRVGGHGRHSFGSHVGAGGGHGVGRLHLGAHTATAHGSHGVGGAHAGHAQGGHSHDATGTHGTRGGNAKNAPGATPMTLALLVLGVGRAPLPLVIEFFLICWGIGGFWSVGNLVHAPHPNLLQMIPALSIALGSGVVGSRVAAEIVGRIMPKDESSVVSGDALYGLTGKVAYTVSRTGGRVHVYDEFGTLHDESCRVADGHTEIAKGAAVMIVDRDSASGRLIVESSAALPGRDA